MYISRILICAWSLAPPKELEQTEGKHLLRSYLVFVLPAAGTPSDLDQAKMCSWVYIILWQPPFGRFCILGVLVLGGLVRRAVLFGACIRAPDSWRLPYMHPYQSLRKQNYPHQAICPTLVRVISADQEKGPPRNETKSRSSPS